MKPEKKDELYWANKCIKVLEEEVRIQKLINKELAEALARKKGLPKKRLPKKFSLPEKSVPPGSPETISFLEDFLQEHLS